MNQTQASFRQVVSMPIIPLGESVKFNFDRGFKVSIPGKCCASSSIVLSSPLSPSPSISPHLKAKTTPQQVGKEITITPYCVIIGRGKRCQDNVGNKRLEILAKSVLPRYSQAKEKEDKSEVVSYLIKTVQEAGGSFFKVTSDGKYIEKASISVTRDKVAGVIRNLLPQKYKSSCKSKAVARRYRRERRQKAEKNMMMSSWHLYSTPTCSRTADSAMSHNALQTITSTSLRPLPTGSPLKEEPTILEQLLSCGIVLDLPGDQHDDDADVVSTLSSEYTLDDNTVGSLDACWDKEFITAAL